MVGLMQLEGELVRRSKINGVGIRCADDDQASWLDVPFDASKERLWIVVVFDDVERHDRVIGRLQCSGIIEAGDVRIVALGVVAPRAQVIHEQSDATAVVKNTRVLS